MYCVQNRIRTASYKADPDPLYMYKWVYYIGIENQTRQSTSDSKLHA